MNCAGFLKKAFKPCYILLYSRAGEHVGWKRTAGFFYGLFLGLLFYELIIVDLNFTEFGAIVIGGLISLMLSFGNAFSSQIRCISLLAIPNFGGKAGRGVLKSLVFAFLLSGPIENLTYNGREVVRSFGCTLSLTHNLTRSRYELMFKPFADALMCMKADANEIKDTIRSIREVSSPLTGEIEGEEEMKKINEENDYVDRMQDDTKRTKELDEKYITKGEQIEAEKYEKMYLKKIETRCENQLTKAANKCKKGFAKAYDACYYTVTWVAAWLLCWPMKLTFVCNIAEALGGVGKCDPSKHIEGGFGEGYTYLKHSRETLSNNFQSVKLQYKINTRLKDIVDVRSVTDTAKTVLHQVEVKKSILDHILTIFKRILAFIFIRIILSSQKYHDAYLRDIEFDNFYITKYFRKIDARRKAQEKHTLLPLKKIERKKLVDPWAIKPIKAEKQQILSQTFKLILEMVTATTIVLLDRLFFEALDLVQRHANVEFFQTGHHDMSLQVKGTGMIANLLRSIVKGFNIKKRIKSIRSNAMCLPKPSALSKYYIYKIYGTYFVIYFSILAQAYTLRLRRVICSYFYRKREKRRVLYVYNETLKRRIGFFRYMKKKVQKLAREQRLDQDLNVFAVLQARFPRNFAWLRIFKMARRKCIICGEPEPRKKSNEPGDFEKCATPNCFVVHCAECWNDIGRHCYACDDSLSDDDGFDESDDERVD